MQSIILVVDDDIPLTKTVQRVLDLGNYRSVVAYTAEDGLNLAETLKPDLVLLDVMIPSMGGWAVCAAIRKTSDVPIIFLTALGDTANIVKGLEMGGDDYIVKPFEPEILLARIQAHLRRAQISEEDQTILSFGDDALIVDLNGHTVAVDGEQVELTPREFQLLTVMARNADRVLTAGELVQSAWGMESDLAQDNIKPYIHYLRKKIERDPAAPRWILTVRGVGYRFSMN